MNVLTSIVVALNTLANALGWLLFPIGLLPGWLSATLVAIFTGIAMLVMFKYTSNQRAIKRVRRDIRANVLAVKLFKDSAWVGLKAHGRVFLGAFRLLLLAIVPILVMTIPMVLLLAQLGAWYQAAPLPVGEETVVTVKLNGEPNTPMPALELAPSDAIEDLSGPVRVTSQREVCWNIRAPQPGYHRLTFQIDGQIVEKEIAVGSSEMRVSPIRPAWNWSDALLYPREKPFERESVVKSIEIAYPERDSWTSGTDYWVIYWFIVSLGAGFCLRGVLKVNL
ncbi:MAG: hypothetical protein L0241_25970 [Planctomycetia bacterium]|nr:hypothetical protein [Planctomycetia bacterium]